MYYVFIWPKKIPPSPFIFVVGYVMKLKLLLISTNHSIHKTRQNWDERIDIKQFVLQEVA